MDVMATRKEGEGKVAVVEPQALSVRDAAIYLGIGKSNVWNRVAAGEWPAFRVGRRLLIPKAHLDSLIGSATLENRDN